MPAQDAGTLLVATAAGCLTRQHLVSAGAIGKVYRHFDGKLKVQLLPGQQEVLVSRLTAPGFKQWLNS